MVIDKADRLDKFMDGVCARNPGETEFHQAVHEVAMDSIPYMADKPHYQELRILERMTEPDRIVMFRVTWMVPMIPIPLEGLLKGIFVFD